MKNLVNNLSKFIFPPKCIICDQFDVIDNGICYICFDKLEFISNNNLCTICGYPFEILVNNNQLCGVCLKERPLFQEAKSVIFYNEQSSILIKKLKYYDRTELANYVAKMMYNYDRHFFQDVDIITSVPLYWTKQLKRLYNQSSLIGIHLAKLSNKDFMSNLVVRIKNTRPQFNLNIKQRQKNLANAFEVNMKYSTVVKNKNILIIDDVYTTGETVKLTVQELKKLEVHNVKVFTLARTKI